MSALKYAAIGALQGLGQGMVEEAEARRREALIWLREGFRRSEYNRKRQDRGADRAEDQQIRADERTETREWQVEDRDIRGARGAGNRARSEARVDARREEGFRREDAQRAEDRRNEIADRDYDAAHREPGGYNQRRSDTLADRAASQTREDAQRAEDQKREDAQRQEGFGRTDAQRAQTRSDKLETRDILEAGRDRREGLGSNDDGMKSADSNAIARAIGNAFGGFYDPVNGTFTGINKDVATRALSIMARAEQIFAEAQASGKPIGHRTAADQALREAQNAGVGEADNDPLGLR